MEIFICVLSLYTISTFYNSNSDVPLTRCSNGGEVLDNGHVIVTFTAATRSHSHVATLHSYN